ncbi:MAG: DUF4012 domain-containing protein [bacterium]
MFNKPNLLGSYLGNVKDQAINDLNFAKKMRKNRIKRGFKYVLWFILIIIIVLGFNALMAFNDIKQVYNSSFQAKYNLEQSIYAIKDRDFSRARQYSQQAEDSFAISLARLKRIKYTPIGWLPGIHGKINDVIYLTETGEILSQTINSGASIGEVFFSLWSGEDLAFSRLTYNEKRMVLAKIHENRELLSVINADLDRAVENLDKIKNRDLFMSRDINIDQLKVDVEEVQKVAKVAVPIFQTMPAFAGYPAETNYLFILQNKDELRPTGGFIGTYGTAKVFNGDILKLNTDDIYHLDMPALNKLKVGPPQPLKDYLGINRWLMRDANWSPDWPTSAEQVLWFYQEEASLSELPTNDVDFVIAITPDFIIDLINITGPITVNGQTYTQDNFMALLQDTTGKDFYNQGISRWHRKMIIGEISKEIKLKLFDSLDENWMKLVDVVEKNLNQKNILIYAKDPAVAKVFADNNWDGHLRQTEGDYVMVVDANLAALKTDAVMKRKISYRVVEENGELIAKLRINYANQGNFTWKTTRYRSYTRVYVPAGSELIRVTGFTEGEVEVGQELDKTYFGAFINIEPGKLGSLTFEYKLPKLIKNGEYSLIFQKQPGTVSDLDIDLEFENELKSYKPANFNSELVNRQRIKYKSNLELDNEYYLQF